MTRVAICTTTIFPIRTFLERYVTNLKTYGRERDVTVVVAGDRKAPADVDDSLAWAKREGVRAEFLTIEWQRQYLSKYPDLAAIIPEQSDNRRNVAFVKALDDGAELIISVDDDNYPLMRTDFVGEHSVVGTPWEGPTAKGAGGWYNLCSLLTTGDRVRDDLFPRGFPFSKRQPETATVSVPGTVHVGANAGLWIGDPDVDAVARLQCRPQVDGWTELSVVLGEGIHSPINTQNTAVARDAMAAYYYAKMGATIEGLTVDRFGDILSGYFLQLCLGASQQGIRIGTPVAEHRRHPHDYLRDLRLELGGMLLIEDLTANGLFEPLPDCDCASAYSLLSKRLNRLATDAEPNTWTYYSREFIRTTAANMLIWLDVVKDVL